jgi:hypothetical protein
VIHKEGPEIPSSATKTKKPPIAKQPSTRATLTGNDVGGDVRFAACDHLARFDTILEVYRNASSSPYPDGNQSAVRIDLDGAGILMERVVARVAVHE